VTNSTITEVPGVMLIQMVFSEPYVSADTPVAALGSAPDTAYLHEAVEVAVNPTIDFVGWSILSCAEKPQASRDSRSRYSIAKSS
jgi:hypothetical protein